MTNFLHILYGTLLHNCPIYRMYGNAVTVMSLDSILIYIQQDAMLHTLFYLETSLHVSGGTSTHHQENKQLYLQYLVFVTPVTATCRYSGRWQ